MKPLLPALESPPGGEPRGNFAQNRISDGSDHIEVGGGGALGSISVYRNSCKVTHCATY